MRLQPGSIGPLWENQMREHTDVANDGKSTGKLILFIFREYRAHYIILSSY